MDVPLKIPIIEQLEQLKARVDLVKADRRAYIENLYCRLVDKQTQVMTLREENRRLRSHVKARNEADEIIINQAFQKRPVERATLASKSAIEARNIMNYRVCGDMKRLNLLRYETYKKQQQLEELFYRQDELDRDLAYKEASIRGETDDSQAIRSLENRLDKVQLKCGEAQQINKTYRQIKNKFVDEYLTFGKTLDKIQTEIDRTKKELVDVKVMYKDALISAKEAQLELDRHEEVSIAERRRREIEITNLREVACIKKFTAQRQEKKCEDDDILEVDDIDGLEVEDVSSMPYDVIASLLPFALDVLSLPIIPPIGKEFTAEQIFQQLKAVAGVTDLREMIQRFEQRNKALLDLEKQRNTYKSKLQSMQKHKELLLSELCGRKFDEEGRLNTEQSNMKSDRAMARQEAHEVEMSIGRLRDLSQLLLRERTAMAHLIEKLHQVKCTAYVRFIRSDDTDNAPDEEIPCIGSKYMSRGKSSRMARDARRNANLLYQVELVRGKMIYVKKIFGARSLQEEARNWRYFLDSVILGGLDWKFYLENFPSSLNTRVELPCEDPTKKQPLSIAAQFQEANDRSDEELQHFYLNRIRMKQKSQNLVQLKSKKATGGPDGGPLPLKNTGKKGKRK